MCMQAQAAGGDDVLDFIKTISQRKFTVEEAKQAKEVFMVGSSTMVRICKHAATCCASHVNAAEQCGKKLCVTALLNISTCR